MRPPVRIRALEEGDAEAVREARLRGLRDEPDAFGSAYEDESQRPLEHTIERLREKRGTDDVALGAFDDGALVGIVTFKRRNGRKERHKADVFGMYVVPEARRRRVGRALLDAVLERARSLDGLEQVHLTVSTTKPAARALYASLGFRPYGLERRALQIGDAFVDEEYLVLFL